METCALSRSKKLVHLDLKGAPPRINYLHELIQLFADLGANGILIEYEDMFPYEEELQILQSKSHPPYSREEILAIQDVAYSRGLEIIPLVQTFGHLEVLPVMHVIQLQQTLGLRTHWMANMSMYELNPRTDFVPTDEQILD